jgi:hypothetical protein
LSHLCCLDIFYLYIFKSNHEEYLVYGQLFQDTGFCYSTKLLKKVGLMLLIIRSKIFIKNIISFAFSSHELPQLTTVEVKQVRQRAVIALCKSAMCRIWHEDSGILKSTQTKVQPAVAAPLNRIQQMLHNKQ